MSDSYTNQDEVRHMVQSVAKSNDQVKFQHESHKIGPFYFTPETVKKWGLTDCYGGDDTISRRYMTSEEWERFEKFGTQLRDYQGPMPVVTLVFKQFPGGESDVFRFELNRNELVRVLGRIRNALDTPECINERISGFSESPKLEESSVVTEGNREASECETLKRFLVSTINDNELTFDTRLKAASMLSSLIITRIGDE